MSISICQRLGFAAAALVAIITPCSAGPEALDQSKESKNVEMVQPPTCDPRWSIRVDGGGDFNVGGTLSNGFSRPFDVLTVIGPFPARVETRDRDWDDAFDDAWHVGGQVGFALTQHLELFGGFRYEHAEGVNRTTEHVFVDLSRIGGSARTDFPFIRDWGDYSSWGGELGFRYYFLSREARFRPYLSLAGGANHTDGIDISTRIDLTNFGGPPGFEIFKGGFFDDSWVATGAAMLGVEVRLACHWAVGVESGIRYESRLEDNDNDYRGLAAFDGLFAVPLRAFRESNDDAGDRWSVPVTGYLKFKF
jgi:opacity protein-like surface antigen